MKTESGKFVAGLMALACICCAAIRAPAQEGRRPNAVAATESELNVLTPAEKAAGWRLLFDGQTTNGWRSFRKSTFPSPCWSVEEGALKLNRGFKRSECGDIITVDQFSSFELEFEWRITPGGNSGVKYLISEVRPSEWQKIYMEQEAENLKKISPAEEKAIAKLTPEMWNYAPIGFEFQLIDDQRNRDARSGPKRITGALYDLLPPSQSPAHPAGEYSRSRIVVKGSNIEHWVNGIKVLEFERGSEQLKAAIAQSKFRRLEGFGSWTKGHIDLQDHQSEVWFRNIKIRELAAK